METAPKSGKVRTWHHLNTRRRPTEYEIVSVMTHWTDNYWDHPFKSMNQGIPLNRWYIKNRTESPLQVEDWQAFRDPDEVIYRTYTTLQDSQENYVTGLLERFANERRDAELETSWIAALAKLYAPLRYMFHGLQMASGYLTQIAPGSTFFNCAAFQSGDQLRWLSHTAYRTRELAKRFPLSGFGEREREIWEQDPAWQGLRELLERTLVAYDVGEAIVALQIVTKPAFDEACLRQLAVSARRNGDQLLALMNEAALVDSERSRRWTKALVEHILGNPRNRAVMARWIDTWVPIAERAIDGYCMVLPDNPDASAKAKRATAEYRAQLGF
jgi:toluene monooxygenase system protein E